jgi:hypothetical protein
VYVCVRAVLGDRSDRNPLGLGCIGFELDVDVQVVTDMSLQAPAYHPSTSSPRHISTSTSTSTGASSLGTVACIVRMKNVTG